MTGTLSSAPTLVADLLTSGDVLNTSYGNASGFDWETGTGVAGALPGTPGTLSVEFTSVVPEPSSVALLALGAMGLLTDRRRRRRGPGKRD
jgi:hypothetical protein